MPNGDVDFFLQRGARTSNEAEGKKIETFVI
jgi:hypothetical protein